MKIALVHDYLVQYGGAERVLECFCEIFPHAHIYTIVHDEKLMHGFFSDKKIHTSFLQKFPFAKKRHRIFPMLMPLAVEQFDFSDYDVVLSDSSSYAKGIITGPDTLHVCYMHTPMRYAWDDCQKYTREFSFPDFIKKLVPFFVSYLRIWDRVSVDRIDKLIANSKFVAKRISKYYQRESTVINPPVSIDKFYIEKDESKKGDYFLIVGRLLAYKRVDITIKAFNELGLPLKIIGRGPEIKRLQKIAGPNIEFLGRVEDDDLPKYYAECRGFVFPQEEDFGIVAIEAMASGIPLIAYKGGDIVENMEDGKTGVFFERQTPEGIIEAIRRFEKENYDSEYIQSISKRFDRDKFKREIREYVEKELKNHKEDKI
ncbi:glycosyltransferase [Patescibacteria group bacterium]